MTTIGAGTSGDAHPQFDDETLMRFADGTLDEETTMRLEQALEADEALALRIERLDRSRAILKEAFDPILREPVPERLTRAAFGRPAEDRPASAEAARPAAKRPAMARFGLPLAAALALVAALGGYLGGRIGGQDAAPAGAMATLSAAERTLVAALSEAPDGVRAAWGGAGLGGDVEIRDSYRTQNGFCRSFGVSQDGTPAFAGLACRTPAGWRTEVVVAEAAAGDGFAPAGDRLRAIDTFLDATAAGEPLDETAVREQIAAGWQAAPR
jgi:surface antigen